MEGTNPGKSRKKLAVMREEIQDCACRVRSPLVGCGMAGTLGESCPLHRHLGLLRVKGGGIAREEDRLSGGVTVWWRGRKNTLQSP